MSRRMNSSMLMMLLAHGLLYSGRGVVPGPPNWLREIDITSEHTLIQEKKSCLPRAKREIVERAYKILQEQEDRGGKE